MGLSWPKQAVRLAGAGGSLRHPSPAWSRRETDLLVLGTRLHDRQGQLWGDHCRPTGAVKHLQSTRVQSFLGCSFCIHHHHVQHGFAYFLVRCFESFSSLPTDSCLRPREQPYISGSPNRCSVKTISDQTWYAFVFWMLGVTLQRWVVQLANNRCCFEQRAAGVEKQGST